MKYKDLSREQIIELKEQILMEIRDGYVTADDFRHIDELVSDEMCEKEYGNLDFDYDDFLCGNCELD